MPARKPRILMIGSKNCPIPPVAGGAIELWIYRIARMLADRFDVLVVSPADRRLAADEIDGGARFVRIETPEKWGRIAKNLPVSVNPYIKKGLKVAKEFGPDIVHVFNTPRVIPYYRRYLKRGDTRYILHMMNLITHIGKRSRPDDVKKLDYDAFVGCSNYIVETERGRLGFGAHRHEVLTNCADPGVFAPGGGEEVRRRHILGDRPVLLFVGRLNLKKGIATIVDAMPAILKKFEDAVLLCLGSEGFGAGGEKRKTEIDRVREKAARMGDSIRFTGFIDPTEVHEYFRAADVFLAPSIWEEPLAFVHIEACSCALPVVASGTGGTPELITDGENGVLLSDPKDPGELARAVIRLLGDEALRTRLGNAARKNVLKNHTWEKAAADTAHLYMSLLGREFQDG